MGLYRKYVGMTGLFSLGVFMCLIKVITNGKGLEFNRRFIAPFGSRLVLFLIGIRVENLIVQPEHKCVFFFNHNSLLDLFLIPMLGLKRTRYIITEKMQEILPLHLCNLGMGALYIPTKEERERRINFFVEVSEELKSGDYSVICSPEGRHEFRHWIANFNKGVFHMAMVGELPIHTIFFDIPKTSNPLRTFQMKPCTVKLKSLHTFQTNNWTIESLNNEKKLVRKSFLDHYLKSYGDYGESPNIEV